VTTVTTPSFEGILLEAVEELARKPAHARDQRAMETCLDLLQHLGKFIAGLRQVAEKGLANGTDAGMFTRLFGPVVAVSDRLTSAARGLRALLAPMPDAKAEGFATELCLVEREAEAFRDLITEALRVASEPSRPVDWQRVGAAQEAHARGETKPFLRR
jgi:hypothetical protein